MGSHRLCSPSECCRIWNELHVMQQTIDTNYKPNAETSNFDDMVLWHPAPRPSVLTQSMGLRVSIQSLQL